MATLDAAAAHTPVLLERCLELLAPVAQNDGSVIIDATLGMGGHTEGILERFPKVTVLGIDRDPQAIEMASRRLMRFGDRFQPYHTTYDQIPAVAATHGTAIHGILLDAGVSSLQLDEVERGFSYARDAHLDMRMNPTEGISAAELIAEATPAELTRILRTYGEEPNAGRIVKAILNSREHTPIESTQQLVDLIREALPAAAMRTGGNPAKRTFQALRIAVNSELDILASTVPAALETLSLGGRMVVESYHSLEDRIVKRAFSAGLNNSAPPDLPIIPEEYQPYLKALTKGAEKADQQEREHNPRSASVRLRAVEKIRNHNPISQVSRSNK
ncbi:16S rRNA (cytosine(1402)-N(4))-methyltransferase RsmH [Boudabousia marimammalium]|uniref:16S rRNA (cytosine(1402)-N(4))-methyltransferase RsmH n=1 Tax=Boudabousia marimammalium TaxID=156892 RepID=UPI001FE3DD93|nr:16S rRNA (cytosine(1402)-N(4))-methyltransferase RsmH [Boudabousia marimammalium]